MGNILNLHISCSFQQGLHTLNHPHLWIQTCYSVCIYITLTHIDVQTWSHLALGYLPLAHKHFSNVSRDKISLIKHSFSYGSMPISSCVIRTLPFTLWGEEMWKMLISNTWSEVMSYCSARQHISIYVYRICECFGLNLYYLAAY